MKVVGLISGTSHDAIEAAAAELELHDDVVSMRVLGSSSTPYEAELRNRLLAALPPAQTTLAEVAKLETQIGQAFAAAAAALLDELPDGADLIASHGQTVFHWVEGPHALGGDAFTNHLRARRAVLPGQPQLVVEAA